MDVGVTGLQSDVEAVAKAQGQGGLVEQELVGIAGMAQGAGGGVEGDGRHHDVDMGVVLDGPSPGVQDGGKSEPPAEFGSGDVLHGAGTLAQEQIVEDGGMLFADADAASREW